jgi:hypothetical protein
LLINGEIYTALDARKACNLAAYQRPIQEEGETGFSDFYENLQDATIHIPELVE